MYKHSNAKETPFLAIHVSRATTLPSFPGPATRKLSLHFSCRADAGGAAGCAGTDEPERAAAACASLSLVLDISACLSCQVNHDKTGVAGGRWDVLLDGTQFNRRRLERMRVLCVVWESFGCRARGS